MTLRTRTLFAAAVGLWMTHCLPAQEPPRLNVEPGRALTPVLPPSANQQIANTVAANLRQSGQLRHYTIDINFHDGIAELTGQVADQPQREEALRIVQGVPGVERVRDRLTLAETVTQVQANAPPILRDPTPLPRKPESVANGIPAGVAVEPTPIFQAPAGQPYDANPPKMPPYAWPSYAPYNNYSRVAYPTAYPYNAWPFIGPCYPFPKIPLGWRSVKLEWEDGHWWYGKVATKHDWWRLRYW